MLMKKLFIFFFMFFSATVSSTVYAKNIWIVKDIKFNGLKNVSENEVLQNIVFNIGSKITQNDIQNSVKSLFKTGKFDNIKVGFSGQKIIFYIHERPIINDVIILGNKIIDTNILDKYLTKLNIKKGHSFSEYIEKKFIQTIKDFYYDIGRCKFNIKISKIFLPHNTVNLKIMINEGVLIKVNSIKIFGAQNISEKKIISLFKLKTNSNWWNLFHESHYSPKQLNVDLVKLNNFYVNQGYFYFNIDKKEVNFLKENNSVDIKIYISEGQKYNISKFFINGDLFDYRPLIKDLININHNEPYNKDKINLIVNRIKRLLFEHGYIDAQIIVIPEINYEKKTIVLNFNIDIKNKFYVHKIYFQGNELTKDKVLRRLMKQMEGECFNLKLVESGKILLENTKYFSQIQVINNKISSDSNQIDIIYKVKEQPTGSINFGLGYGIDSGISFNTSFSQDNIFGSGNSLKSSIIKNKNQKYIDLSINYPYFIFDKTDLNTRLFFNDFKYNFNSVSNINKHTYGFESNLGFPINDANKINFGIGYSHNGIFNNDTSKINKKIKTPSSINTSLNDNILATSLVDDFTLNYSWTYNTLKYIYFPISGNQTYISGKNTIPGSDNNFYKIILDSEQYVPLDKLKKFIFLSHIHMGIGNSFNNKKLPFYENFYADSSNHIRGFRSKTIGPKKIYDNVDLDHCMGYQNNDSCESIDSIGGNATFSTNLEFIIPIPFLNEIHSQFLRSSIFFDVGNIWDTKLNNKNYTNTFTSLKHNIIDDIYSSFGLSLEWFSPIGPLVFSYSIPIQKNKNHHLEPFQFNIGKNW
ncbi:outer membrane protein assembly factor BamA [Buchnera aphidicola (Diuraphis noxia)]|uniref:Outer membrane protein assembly factor BamA n=2 Tax=Buchnera aphidicola TaxID=9 RepID=A0A1B2H8V2_BUCDN|nr:outer membrane protein assembly factor BamA [Buchnera aphidicola (Diuraphis noxia)]